MRTAARLASLAGALTLGCASAPTSPPDSPEHRMKREGDLAAATGDATPDGTVRARVAGHLIGEFERTSEGSHYGVFDIGTESPVGCFLYDERKEPATHLAMTSDRLFEQIGAQRPIGRKAVYGIDAGHAGPYPYLGVDWIATLDCAGYHLKQKFGNRGERSLYCLHDDAGYQQTFDAFFAGFLASLELPEEPQPPQFREISVIRISGQE